MATKVVIEEKAMDLGIPINSVVPGVAGIVLQILARTDQPLTGHGIAKLAEGHSSIAGVTKTLKHLVASGLVESKPAGRANLYSLNRQHVAAGAIESLANLRHELIQRIRSSVFEWVVPAEAVLMFGSAARGDGSVSSDVDLLIVRPELIEDEIWVRQLLELSKKINVWSGNSCELIEYTQAELQTLKKKKDPLVQSLLNEAIVISGSRLNDLVGAA